MIRYIFLHRIFRLGSILPCFLFFLRLLFLCLLCCVLYRIVRRQMLPVLFLPLLSLSYILCMLNEIYLSNVFQKSYISL